MSQRVNKYLNQQPRKLNYLVSANQSKETERIQIERFTIKTNMENINWSND